MEKGKRVEITVPENMKDEIEHLSAAVYECVAETSEEAMEKYFSGEEFTVEEVIQGVRIGVKELSLFPVFCGCALSGIGTEVLLDAIVHLLLSQGYKARRFPRTVRDGGCRGRSGSRLRHRL